MHIFHHDCHIGMHTCYTCRRSWKFRRGTRFRGAGTWLGIYHANYKGRCTLKKVKGTLIALGYKKIGIRKACMGIMHCREDAHDVGDNASLRMALNRVI